MAFATYADVLRIPVVRRILLLGMLIRVPLWASNVVLTLHVVGGLDRSYAEAGLVSMVAAVALAVSGPWRGRRLDRTGLRATVLPSIIVCAGSWSVAPWLGYWPLLLVAGFASLFAVPSFSIVRQVLIAHVPDHHRTTVLSVDSVATELTFIAGPVLGVLAATSLPTSLALLLCQLAGVAAAIVLWMANPPLHSERSDVAAGHVPVRTWLTPAVVTVLAVAATSATILTGQELSTVAALRSWDQAPLIGVVLGLMGAGSAVGGIVYGALRPHPSAAALLVGLACTTALVAIAPGGHLVWFVVLLTISNLFCAPTITATVDDLSRGVPAGARGEAIGWHGSALTLGSAVSAPLVGLGLDHGGWTWGFGIAGGVGLLVALPGLALARRRAAGQATGGHDVVLTVVQGGD